MEPASTIVKKLGGTGVVARVTGVHITRVSGWQRPREKGGTGGRIPQGHIPRLVEYANENGIDLSFKDFFRDPDRVTPDSSLPAVYSTQHMGD